MLGQATTTALLLLLLILLILLAVKFGRGSVWQNTNETSLDVSNVCSRVVKGEAVRSLVLDAWYWIWGNHQSESEARLLQFADAQRQKLEHHIIIIISIISIVVVVVRFCLHVVFYSSKKQLQQQQPLSFAPLVSAVAGASAMASLSQNMVFDQENLQLCLGQNGIAKIVLVRIGDNVFPWFQAKPIVVGMGYLPSHVSQTIGKIPEKHRKPLKELLDMGGELSDSSPTELGHNDKIAMYLSEPGLYELFGKSELASARPFQDWLYEEVLPLIRNTGSYHHHHHVAPQKRSSAALEDAREQLELATIHRQIEAERRQAEAERRQTEAERRERVFETMKALEDAGMSVDDRMKVHARDYLASSGMGAQVVAVSSSSQQQRQEICLQSFVRDHRNDTTPPITNFQNTAIQLGKLCVKHAKNKFGETFVPNKKTILCNGQQMQVNCWWHDEHKDIVETAWAEQLVVISIPKAANSSKPEPKKRTRRTTTITEQQ